MKELEIKKLDVKVLRLQAALAELEMKKFEREMEVKRIDDNIEIQKKAIEEIKQEQEELRNV